MLLSSKSKPGILQKTVGNIIFRTLDKNGDGILYGNEAGGMFKNIGSKQNAITYSSPENTSRQTFQSERKQKDYYELDSHPPLHKQVYSEDYPSRSYTKKSSQPYIVETVEYQEPDYNNRRYQRSSYKSNSRETEYYSDRNYNKRNSIHSNASEVISRPALEYRESWHTQNPQSSDQEIKGYTKHSYDKQDQSQKFLINSQPELNRAYSSYNHPHNEMSESKYGTGYLNAASSYPIASPGYPTAAGGYPIADPGHATADPRNPISSPGYTNSASSFPIAGPGYPNAESSYPIAAHGYPNVASSYPTAAPDYPITDHGHAIADPRNPIPGPGYPNAGNDISVYNPGYPINYGPGYSEIPNGMPMPHIGFNF